MAKESFKTKYERLLEAVRDYVTKVNARKYVQHSSTPAVVVRGETKGAATIQINELITVVKTAKALGKIVTLEADDKNLVLYLQDNYPGLWDLQLQSK